MARRKTRACQSRCVAAVFGRLYGFSGNPLPPFVRAGPAAVFRLDLRAAVFLARVDRLACSKRVTGVLALRAATAGALERCHSAAPGSIRVKSGEYRRGGWRHLTLEPMPAARSQFVQRQTAARWAS